MGPPTANARAYAGLAPGRVRALLGVFSPIATTVTSMVLSVPLKVSAEIVSWSPTLASSFLACSSKSMIEPGLRRSSMFPAFTTTTFRKPGSWVMSMPPIPTCIEPLSLTSFAQPRPRWVT